MPTQPDTDTRLRETATRQAGAGWRLLALAVALFATGAVLVLLTSGIGDFAGVALCALAVPPTWAALGLLLTGGVGRRAAQRKPFA